MKTIRTHGIVLSRIEYGEADRIITMLSPDHGKLRLMAKGVRRVKSKLAGGIELFSTSDISFIRGKGEIGTLVSTQLISHYGKIIKDINRVQLGYDLIKLLNKATEDSAEKDYYFLLEKAFSALNDSTISLGIVSAWFSSQLLVLSGHTPNLNTDSQGNKLTTEDKYNFDFDSVGFVAHASGRFSSNQIRTMRLLFSGHTPAEINSVSGVNEQLDSVTPLINTLRRTYQHF